MWRRLNWVWRISSNPPLPAVVAAAAAACWGQASVTDRPLSWSVASVHVHCSAIWPSPLAAVRLSLINDPFRCRRRSYRVVTWSTAVTWPTLPQLTCPTAIRPTTRVCALKLGHMMHSHIYTTKSTSMIHIVRYRSAILYYYALIQQIRSVASKQYVLLYQIALCNFYKN